MIGRDLRKIRLQKGMSLTELATLSGVSKSYISSIERGLKSNPSILILEKLSKALNIPLTNLIE